MPNKVILNDRVGIPNRLWPIRSELTEPQCKARHLGSPETQQEWGAPFCSNSSFSCLGKDPASLTQPIFVYISHTQEAGTMHACAALCLTENSVSHGWLTSKHKEIPLLHSSSGSAVHTSHELAKSKSRVYTDCCATAAAKPGLPLVI